MADNIVEKNFLHLILLSVIVHAAILFLLLHMPQEENHSLPEPLMVDLEGVSTLAPPKFAATPVERQSEAVQRVKKETAPKGDASREKIALGRQTFQRPSVAAPEPKGGIRPPSAISSRPDLTGRERSLRDEFLEKRSIPSTPDATSFYPGAAKMARIEESYRKKYGPEVADGETRFLNTDDIQFGSFLRRFESAIYGVWRYPGEAARMGIEGITPVRITFNRRGEIVGRELLQSSGSNILDSEVLRSLDQVGPVGAFPRGYEKETFHLIAFFHYGIAQGTMRSLR